MVILVIDSLSITEYKSKNGKLMRTKQIKPGFYNIIPTESVFSKATTLFLERIQITGRSCEISKAIYTTIEAMGDLLSDIFRFTFNGTIILEEYA